MRWSANRAHVAVSGQHRIDWPRLIFSTSARYLRTKSNPYEHRSMLAFTGGRATQAPACVAVLLVVLLAGVQASTRPWTDMTLSYNAAGNAPRPRTGHAITTVGPLMYVIGGRYSDAAQYYSAELVCAAGSGWNGKYFDVTGCTGLEALSPEGLSLLSYDLQGGVWSEVEAFSIPDARAFHAAAAMQSTLYVHGGNNVGGTSTLDECFMIDMAATRKEWSADWCAGGPSKRYGHSLTHVDGKLYVFGGAVLTEGSTQVRYMYRAFPPAYEAVHQVPRPQYTRAAQPTTNLRRQY